MKNMSIRTRILGGVVLIMALGAIIVVVYLHQSYSSGLDVTAQKSLTLSVSTWDGLNQFAADEFGPVTNPQDAMKYLENMKKITTADYALLIDRQYLDEKAYAAEREAAGLPNNFSEGGAYVQVATTDDVLAAKMQFNPTPDSVPEMGKFVGIENGACSKLCHNGVTGTGDYWTVRWSDDSRSRAHVVFPVNDASGKPIGVMYSIDDISAQADSAKSSMINTLIVIGITLLIATLVIGGMMDALVFKRLNRMIVTMEDLSLKVAGGDFDAHFEPDGTGDEIGKFEQFFSQFLELVSSTLKMLHKG